MFSKRMAITLPWKQLMSVEFVKATQGLPKQGPVLNALNFMRFMCSEENYEKNLYVVKLASQVHMVPYESENTVPIIILHGLLGSKNNWYSMAKAIMRGTNNRLVITLDARNHGDSGHTVDFSYKLMVGDLIRFLSDHNITRASFIGHSMGGRVCMLLAQTKPEIVRDLIVVDISPVGQSPNMLELPKIFQAIKGVKVNPLLPVPEARREAFAQLKHKLRDEKLVNFIVTNLAEKGDGYSWKWKFNIESISMNFVSEICKYPNLKQVCERPTLFIAGGNSDYIKPEEEPAIKRIFPSSRFVYIPGAGHWVHAEQPKVFLDNVLEFLNKNALEEE